MLVAIFFVNCEKDYYFVKKINIKGKISQSGKISASRIQSSTKGYSLSEAKKVLIFYGNEYDLVNIRSDGSFSGRAPLGSATVVAFLTQNNEFIGNLYCGGMNLLPLVGVADDVSTIDFSTLTLDGTRVIPANDPVGKTILLTEEEIGFMKEVGAYYEALAKNIDMNNDGEPDVLQNSFIFINTNQNFFAGKWGINDELPELISKEKFDFDYKIWIVLPNNLLSSTDNSIIENAVLSGPLNNPHTDIQNAGNSYFNSKELKLNFARAVNSNMNLSFNPGEYKLSIDNKNFTFNYSNINTLNYWMIAIPTLHTNSQNEVTNITLTYQFPNGETVDPRKLTRTGIQVQMGSNENGQPALEIRSKESDPTDPDYDYYNIVINPPKKLSEVTNLNLSYIDIFGNNCGNQWRNALKTN